MRMLGWIVLLVVAQGVAACSGSDSLSAPLAPSVAPSASSPAPQPTDPFGCVHRSGLGDLHF
jgi:hypothetical protein